MVPLTAKPPASLPAVGLNADEQPLPPATGAGADAEQPGRQDARVVEDEQVAGPEQLGQVVEVVVVQGSVLAADDEEAGVVAR